MYEEIKEIAIGKRISYMEHSGEDDYGYVSDSIVFHTDGSRELRIYVEEGDCRMIRAEISDSAVPLQSVYPRSFAESIDDILYDISFSYSADGSLSLVRLIFQSCTISVSLPDDEQYALRICYSVC